MEWEVNWELKAVSLTQLWKGNSFAQLRLLYLNSFVWMLLGWDNTALIVMWSNKSLTRMGGWPHGSCSDILQALKNFPTSLWKRSGGKILYIQGTQEDEKLF